MRVCHTQDAAKISASFDFVNGFLACYLFYRIAADRLPETEVMASRSCFIFGDHSISRSVDRSLAET
jgi:hypothetical protein